MHIKHRIILTFILSGALSACSFPLCAMEWMNRSFNKMVIKENREIKKIYLVDELFSYVELDIVAARLSPRLQRIIDEEQDKARMSGSPWDGFIYCTEIAQHELQTIKQVLETMYHYAQKENTIHQKFLIADAHIGGQEAVSRWGEILKEYLFPRNETLKKTMFFFKNNWLDERYRAAGYFELPLLQEIIKQEAKKELRGMRNASINQVPSEVWHHHIFPKVIDHNNEWKTVILSECGKAMPYKKIKGAVPDVEINALTYRKKCKCYSIAFPTNDKILTGHYDGFIKVWNSNGELITELQPYSDYVTTMACSSDGNYFASASTDGIIKIWDAEKFQEVRSWRAGGYIWHIVFASDCDLLASVTREGVIVWDFKKGEAVRQFGYYAHHEDHSCTFSSNGKLFAESTRGSEINIWNTSTWERHQQLPGNCAFMAFSPDNKWFAAGNYKDVTLWDTQTWTPRTVASCNNGDKEFIGHLAFSPDSKLIAIVKRGSDTVSIRNCDTGTVVTNLSVADSFIQKITFSPNGQQLLGMSGNQGAYLWNLDSLFRCLDYLNTKTSFPEWLLLKKIVQARAQGQKYSITDHDQKVLNIFGGADKELNTLAQEAAQSHNRESYNCLIQ